VGCERVIKVGGVQAIGGMAYGTETIPAVDKIFGPGNQYVTEAKQLVSKAGLAIDMPAGPSEVMVVADSSARAEFIAADLLSQAEHGADSQVMLLTMDEALISEVQLQITAQLKVLPRKEIAQQCLENSTMILLKTMGEMLEMVNEYAPEHLIVALRDAVDFSAGVINSGSVFLGNYSPEAVGDYASGTNHTLPTNGAARAYSGVSIDSFVKKITFQKITRQGLLNIGPAVEIMAEAEQLDGHKNAVTVRLNVLAGENLKRTPASNNK
jgi:histidinol dehydrogenase